MNYKQFREQCGVKTADMIAFIKARYPRYGKATQSMVDNPEKYGICLLPEVEQELVLYNVLHKCGLDDIGFNSTKYHEREDLLKLSRKSGMSVVSLVDRAITDFIHRHSIGTRF